MKNETYREMKNRMNKLLDSIPKNTKEERSKVYSWSSLKENKIEPFVKYERGGWNIKWCDK